MFVTNWISTTKIQKISEITNFFRHYFLSRTEVENERTMYGLAYEARKFNGERDYVWPLPTAELDTNKKLVQHDLWK